MKAWSMTLALAAVFGLAGCARHEAPAADAGTPADAATPAPAAAPATPPVTGSAAQAAADQPLQLADLDAYARGAQAEIARLQQSADRVRQARASKDDGAEMTALTEMSSSDVEAAGAQAARLDPARYAFVKSAVEGVLGKLEMLEGLKTMAADDGEATPEMRKQMADNQASLQAQVGDPYAGLASDVAAAMKARHAELARLRAQSIAVRAGVL